MMRKSLMVTLTAVVMLLLFLSNACSLSNGKLEVEAQIIYKMGGPQPVARTTFYLLDKSIEEMTELDKAYRANFYDKWYDEGIGKSRKKHGEFLMQEGYDIWRTHVIQSAKTDFNGRATFEDIKPGNYWVFGRAEARGDEHLTWNVKVTIKRGENKLVLSNDNYGLQWPDSVNR